MSEPIDEGYLKFECEWLDAPPPEAPGLLELVSARDLLHGLDLIGEYPDGIGFGNVSLRTAEREFIITGTQTGGLERISPLQLTRVVDYDIERNRVTCVGAVRASSESLTHAAIYECSPAIGAVVHVHSAEAWERLLDRMPTTQVEVAYGTPAMARELLRLYRQSNLPDVRVAVMAGHREGILAFGGSVVEAIETLLDALGEPS